MTVITMPDGRDVEFPDDMPRERIRAIILHKFPDAEKQAAAPADDHGLARRQAMSGPEKVLSPITEYPRNYQEMSLEAQHQVGRGVEQLGSAFTNRAKPGQSWLEADNLSQGITGAANVALGSLGYVASPISAAYRSIAGQPIEDVTGIPREYTEFGAQLATPGIGFTRMPGAPGAPVNPGNYRPPAAPTLKTGPSGTETAQAMERLRAEGIDVDAPRAITSDNTTMQRIGQGVSNTPVVGDPLATAIHDTVPAQIRRARDTLAAQRGTATEANAAGRATTALHEAAAAETKAATEAAARGDEAARAAHQAAVDQYNARIAAFEADSAGAVEARTGRVNPQDAGAQVTDALREAEAAAISNKEALYKRAGEADAAVRGDEVSGAHARVAKGLDEEGVVLDPLLTPAASRMLSDIERLSGGGADAAASQPRPALRQLDNEEAASTPRGVFPGDRSGPVKAPVSVQDIEQARKRLVFLRSAASNDADRRAATHVMRQFDKWQSDAFESALLSGDPEALANFRKARDANRDWRERFGYNERDDVNNIVQKILHKDVTPQEVANWLIGSGKVGKQGTTSRLYDGVMKATGNNPELAQSIRGAIWDTLSGSKTAAADIREFVHKSGRDLAEKVFPQGSRELMLRHADTLDKAKTARDLVTDAAKASAPKATKVEKGPTQQLADRVIGGKMGKDEALWKTIEGYTREGGDVKALAGLVRDLPPDMKGDIAGAVVRGLGQNQSGGFSLDLFSRDWGKITPQAKAVLFGNAGAHLKSLDDLALIAQRLKDVKGKYGNPSGTGQTTAFQQLSGILAGIVGGHFAPGATATAVGGAVAGNVAARVLASPASASSIAKYARALEQQARNPTPQGRALVNMAERNLVNTVKTIGAAPAAARLPAPMRSIQGPVPAGAENEQR